MHKAEVGKKHYILVQACCEAFEGDDHVTMSKRHVHQFDASTLRIEERDVIYLSRGRLSHWALCKYV